MVGCCALFGLLFSLVDEATTAVMMTKIQGNGRNIIPSKNPTKKNAKNSRIGVNTKPAMEADSHFHLL